MLLPGVLLGMAVQVHQMALSLWPAVLLAVLMDRQILKARLGALFMGAAAVVAISVPAMHIIPPDQMVEHIPEVVLPLHEVYVHHLGVLLRYPLASLGLALLVAAWFERRWRGPLVRLTLLWFVLGGLVVSVTLLFFAEKYGPRVTMRYALVNPARAVMAAVALAWLLGWITRLTRRFTARRLAVGHVLIGLALAACLLLGQQVMANRSKYLAVYERQATRQCFFGYSTHYRYSRYIHRLFDELEPCWRPLPPGRSQMVTDYEFEGYLELLWLWSGYEAAEDEPEDEPHTFVAPAFPTFDVSRHKWGRRCGAVDVLHNGRAVTLSKAGAPGRYRALESRLRQGDLLGLYVSGLQNRALHRVWLSRAGRRLAPLDGCEHLGIVPLTPSFPHFQGWYLFKVPAALADADPGKPLELHLKGPLNKIREATLVNFGPLAAP